MSARERQSTETYTVGNLSCKNCRWEQDGHLAYLEIPKGQTVGETPCPKCGCLTLSKGWR